MTTHELCEKARRVSCVCGALPGFDCLCELPGVHLSRFAHARTEHVMTFPELASVISDHDVYTGTTIVLDVT
jgi:hypothetical protein